jgi:hypothetical protein
MAKAEIPAVNKTNPPPVHFKCKPTIRRDETNKTFQLNYIAKGGSEVKICKQN